MNEGRNHLTEDTRVTVVVTPVIAILVVVLVAVMILGREDRVIGATEVVAIRRKRPTRRPRRVYGVTPAVAGEVEAAQRLARVLRIGLRARAFLQLRLVRILSSASVPVNRLPGRGEIVSVECALLQGPIRLLFGSDRKRAARNQQYVYSMVP